MTNEELNTQLYKKMSAEQAKFKEESLKQSPEEILTRGYEYAQREEILYVLDGLELDEGQVSALLRSEKPLADLFNTVVATENKRVDISKIIIDSVASRADEILQEERKLRDIPLYKYPASHAHENGELEAYRASHKANIACKEAIERAISDHYADNCLGKGAVKQVVDAFGYERTLYVLANTIRQMNHDGRISNDNKLWAATITVRPDMDSFRTDRNIYLAVNKHPGLIDIFAREARHEHLLSLPLTKEDIKAEALNILSQFQNAKEPNSPSGTHYAAQVSPDFAARAHNKETERLRNMLPFDSLVLCTLNGRRGIFAVIDKDENRFQKLRLRKPSIRTRLAAAKQEQHDRPVVKARVREEAR